MGEIRKEYEAMMEPKKQHDPGGKMKLWICIKCGHEILDSEKPRPIKWTDGHRCVFAEQRDWKKDCECGSVFGSGIDRHLQSCLDRQKETR